MSFYASNDRIWLKNTEGKVIFDTDKPMPHIIQEVTANVSVTFPAVGVSVKRVWWVTPKSIRCSALEQVCGFERVCGYERECMNIGGTITCQDVWRCHDEYVCRWETVYHDEGHIEETFSYTEGEWEQTFNIANVVGGLNADFLLVNAMATRTKRGELADVGPLPCGLPLGQWFIANNTSIVECSSDIRNGNPWMTRIMSVFVEGGKIKVQFKQSNRSFESVSRWQNSACSLFGWDIPSPPGRPPPPGGESRYTFQLKIQVGKFTI